MLKQEGIKDAIVLLLPSHTMHYFPSLRNYPFKPLASPEYDYVSRKPSLLHKINQSVNQLKPVLPISSASALGSSTEIAAIATMVSYSDAQVLNVNKSQM